MIKKVNFILLTLLLIIILLTGCENKAKYIVNVTVEVNDSNTGEIIRTATTMTKDGKTGSTSNGKTTFVLNGEKNYTFISTAPGYNKLETTAYVGKENITLTSSLSKITGTVKGYVVDENDRPIVNATVTLKELNKNTETDEQGYFNIVDVPITGTYSITVKKNNYGERTLSNLVFK